MFWLLVTTTPDPLQPPSNVPDDLVTPGIWGFVITFAVVIAVVLLIIDMVRRMRRVRYRSEINERLDAEEAERAGGTGESATSRADS